MVNNFFENARAEIHGGRMFPEISGETFFRETSKGVLVTTRLYNLPHSEDVCKSRIFALHIHTGTSCTGTTDDEFKNALGHYNPNNCVHPYHAGDLAPIFGNNGYAYSSFLTNRFHVKDIIGKVVILHSMPDDFTTNPSGNSGTKIACGKIKIIS